MFALYSGARLLGLADMGRKVDLMERSIRRGEGGQSELAGKMEQEERGEYPRELIRDDSHHKGDENELTKTRRCQARISSSPG